MKKIPNKKYYSDSNYFESINTEEKAYWLGFLYADGYVRMKYGRSGELRLKLGLKDLQHLESFNNSLSSTYRIKIFNSSVIVGGVKHNSDVCCLSIYNTKTVKDLFKAGCTNNKTFKIDFPNDEIIQHEFISHFIRGYFDGDGCITFRKPGKYTQPIVKIIGNYEFVNKMKDVLSNMGVDKIYINRNGNVFNLLIGRKQNVLIFKNIIYNTSSIFLNRKKYIFDNIKDNE